MNHKLLTLLKLVGMIVVAGALVAALLLPWVGGIGLAARNSTSLLDALPVELTDQTPNGNTKVLAADGQLITEFYTDNRSPVTAEQIAPIMKQAIIDIEDSRFYEHNGLDAQGTLRALAKNVAAGGVEEGGSTLTQQLVKQTLLQTAATPVEAQAATEQTLGRKLREARLALSLEQAYSKDEILTRYLNMAYFGSGAYGIQAAAHTYFSVDAIDLTLPQATVLAGLVQSPAASDPISDPEAAQIRRNQVLIRMNQLGHITDQEMTDALASPVQVAPGARPPNGCAGAIIAGFFCDYLQTYLEQTLGIGQDQLNSGGWIIQTTLRPDLQAAGDQGVLNTLPMGDDLAGVFTAVEPGTGHVLAMSVNRRYGCNDPDCESVNLNTAASAGAGSTYKVFTAVAALAEGLGARYTITAPQPYVSKVYKKEGGTTGAPYTISNVGKNYPDTLNMEEALVRSSNTYFVALEDALGSVEAPVRAAQAMGLRSLDEIAEEIIAQKRGSFTLGPDPTSPLYLASAYSTLAANGTQCDPTPVIAISDRSGQPVIRSDGSPYVSGDSCTPEAIPAGVASTMNQMMIGDTTASYGTATRAAVPGHQISGKTGTTQENKSATFVGSTPKYTASVMVFNPKVQVDVGGYGGNKPATIWRDSMAPVLAKESMAPFPPADPAVVVGNQPVVPSCSSVGECRTALLQLGFQPQEVEEKSSFPAGFVVGTSPPAGSIASPGQVVSIRVSGGPNGTTSTEDSTPLPSPSSTTPSAGDPTRDGTGSDGTD